MLELQTPVLEIAGLCLTVIVTICSLVWWLSGQFTNLRGLIYSTAEKTATSILSKLEYHEKHDDTRFNAVSNQISDVKNDIWELKVRNAAIKSLYINTDDTKLTPISKGVKQLLKEEL